MRDQARAEELAGLQTFKVEFVRVRLFSKDAARMFVSPYVVVAVDRRQDTAKQTRTGMPIEDQHRFDQYIEFDLCEQFGGVAAEQLLKKQFSFTLFYESLHKRKTVQVGDSVDFAFSELQDQKVHEKSVVFRSNDVPCATLFVRIQMVLDY